MRHGNVFLIFSFIVPIACRDKEVTCESLRTEPAYTGTEMLFVDASTDWGLDIIAPTGTRINAVDIDGDGFTDLFIRSNDSSDDFANNIRYSWLLRNTGGGGFEDVTESSGIRKARSIDTGRPGQVVAFADVDNDGDLDVFTGHNFSENTSEKSEILLNDGTGHFALYNDPVTQSLDIWESSMALTSGASFVDVNHDGYVDLWLGQANATQDQLLLGDGTGNFSVVTTEWGLQTSAWSSIAQLNLALGHSVSWSTVACDLNNDGWSELLTASYGRAPNHLWLATGADYLNRSISSGYAFDGNQDWTDNESARCWCKLHPTDTDCSGVPAPTMIACQQDSDAFRWNHSQDRNAFRLGGNSGATVCADFNNDGWMDLLTTEIVHWDVGMSSDHSELLINQGKSDVVFTRPGNENTGLTREHDRVDWNDGDITATYLDFDNDGRKDIYIGSTDYPGTIGLLYHQEADGNFTAVPVNIGVDHHRSHGVAVADFDRDGDLDMVIGHSSGRCDSDCPEEFYVRLYENQLGAGNFLQLHLQGTDANASAIGARVEVETADGIQVQEVGGGYGHYGAQNDLVLHFGLAEDCEATVRITWPDANLSTSEYTVFGGARYTIIQGQDPKREE